MTSTIVRYPNWTGNNKIRNVEGDSIPYRAMWDIENITNDNSSVGHWGSSNRGAGFRNAIAGRNGSRHHPSSIRGGDFGFNQFIPDYARINRIHVQYKYRKCSYSSNAHGSFGNPVISIPSLNLRATGVSPPAANFAEYTTTFNVNLKGRDIDNSTFEVLFDMADNTSTNPCWIEMQYLRVIIEYDVPNYIPQISIDKSRLKYGESALVTCTLSETNRVSSSANVSATIKIPQGLTIVENTVTGLNKNTMVWQSITNNYTSKIEFHVKLASKSAYGDFKLSITENMTGNTATARSSSASINVVQPTVEVQDWDISNNELIKNDTTYISITLINPAETEVRLNMDFNGMTVTNVRGATKNGNQLIVTDWNNGGWADIGIAVKATAIRTYNVSMSSESFIGVYSHTIKVLKPATSDDYYTLISAPDSTVTMLKSKLIEDSTKNKYVFGCLCRLTGTEDSLSSILGTRNLRASVINQTEVLTNQISQIGEWELLTCIFTYNPGYNLQFKFMGNGVEYDPGIVEFGNIFLIAYEDYYGYEYPSLAFNPVGHLINDNDYSHITLEKPNKDLSTNHYFSGFDWMGLTENEYLLIHGIEITGTCSTDDDINLILGFGDKNREIEEYYKDSVKITPEMNQFKFGGKWETFGLEFPEINKLLNDLKFYLAAESDANHVQINMKNIRIALYYTINSNCWDFIINNVSSKYFLLDLDPDTEIPRGANYDVNKFNVEASDGEFPNRVNIEDKKLKLKFDTCECGTVEELNNLLKHVVEWLYPERDNLDNPILKSIAFFYDPDTVYDYYIEDELDAELADGGYECEVELVVPAGLARSREKVEKAYVGSVGHIGKIKPEIIFNTEITNVDEPLQLIEAESGQIFTIHQDFFTKYSTDIKLKLDCKKKQLYYNLYGEWFKIDSNLISLDSDFFTLNGHYNFENSVNCKVQSVRYYELTG